ncbi:MAG: DMT family transporter [Gemmataceae bacterium]|nr:DMT family transporter [Gemmataceae bacterium]MDW8243553.1 DMT family transporter [Thermogemmata sp.]
MVRSYHAESIADNYFFNMFNMFRAEVRPYLLMLCSSFSFTVMAVLVHDIVQVSRICDWQTTALFRAGLVALFSLILAHLNGVGLVWRPWRLWVRSLAGSGSMVCTFYAFGTLPTADVITLTNTFPLWVALLAWPVYGQRPQRALLLAVGIGIAGVALVEQPHFAQRNWGVVAALAAAMFTAVAMLGLHALKGVNPTAVVVHFSCVATLTCAVVFLLNLQQHSFFRMSDTNAWIKLLGMGLAALVGQIFLTRAFVGGAPAAVAVVGLTQIVFALAFDVWLFGYTLNLLTICGTILVVAPTGWVLTHPPRLPTSLPPKAWMQPSIVRTEATKSTSTGETKTLM